MAGPAPAARPLAPPGHSAVHPGSVPPAYARRSARSVVPNRFSSRLRPGQRRFQRLCSSFPSPTVVSPARSLSAVSTLTAANTSGPGASTLRAGLICRAVPALALRSIRCCVPWQVPHPPRDLWRRGHSAVHSGSVPPAYARHSARSVAPNRFSSRLRPGQPAAGVSYAFPPAALDSPRRSARVGHGLPPRAPRAQLALTAMVAEAYVDYHQVLAGRA